MSSASEDEFERVFGVPRDAEPSAVTKAFRQRAAQWHPDRNPGDANAHAKFEQLNRLFAEWSDARKRTTATAPATTNPPDAPKDGVAPTGFPPDVFEGFEQIFQDFFGQGFPTKAPRRGRDLQQPLPISEGEARTGVRRELSIVRGVLCTACKGTGDARADHASKCPECDGAGTRKMQQGQFQIATTCSRCRGRGRTIGKACAQCRDGLVDRREQLTVTVPPNVSSGMKLRLAGKGEEVVGGEAGALYLDIQVRPAGAMVERDGDATIDAPVRGITAILGGSVSVVTPDGSKDIRVPRFVKDGSRITLAGEGYRRGEGADPYRNESSARGNAIVVFRVDRSAKAWRIGGIVGLASLVAAIVAALVR